MESFRRRLPHVYLEGKAQFLTWHLYGSLPHKLYPPPGKQGAGQAFVWMDRYLDSARDGPRYLKQDPVAQLVVGSIRYGAEQLQYYDLDAFVVMANHVHLLARHEKRTGCSGARASRSGKPSRTIIGCATIGRRAASARTLKTIR
ncbi:MAG: hypothetical protein ACLQVN_06505 [Bryobacteraceae bacterium]